MFIREWKVFIGLPVDEIIGFTVEHPANFLDGIEAKGAQCVLNEDGCHVRGETVFDKECIGALNVSCAENFGEAEVKHGFGF